MLAQFSQMSLHLRQTSLSAPQKSQGYFSRLPSAWADLLKVERQVERRRRVRERPDGDAVHASRRNRADC
jgi:hypothetical protein